MILVTTVRNWIVQNTRRAFTLLGWLGTGQFTRAGNALLPYYQRYVPRRVRGMVPRRLSERLLRRLEEPPAHRDSAVAGMAAQGRSRDSVLNLTGYGPISKVLDYSSPTPDPVLQQDSICVHLHLFYTDLADHFTEVLSRLHQDYTLLVSVPEDQDASRWQRYFSERLQRATMVIVKNVPNRGRDALPWVVTFADEIQKHTIFCHLHAKKSQHSDRLRDWRSFLEHSMFGSRHLINQILSLFLEDTSLGLVYPPYFVLLPDRQPAWGENRKQFAALYRRLASGPVPVKCPDFPAGSFFWARTSVLKPLFDLGLTVEDFPAEAGQVDGTLSHALERILGVLPDITGMTRACLAVNAPPVNPIGNGVTWAGRPIVAVFAVTDTSLDTAAGDTFTAHELALALRETYGWDTRLYGPQHWYRLEGVDVVIAMRDDYDPNQIEHRSPGLIKVAWARNWFDRWGTRPWLSEFDLIWCSGFTGAQQLRELSGLPASVLLIATNEQRFTLPATSTVRDFDYVLTSSYWGANRETEEFLFPEKLPFRGAVFGKGWENHRRLGAIHHGFRPYKQLPALYQRAKVVIDDANHVTKLSGSVNSRVFDALASGALVLTNGAIGSREVFSGKLPVFQSASELEELLRRFLNDEAARATLAEELRREVLSKHTYKMRANEVRDALAAYATNVSVIVPNYNYECYLPERLGSIINQTVRPREIIFLDDASTDNSVEVARHILEQSPIPFTIIINETNAGTYQQWLKGIAAAKGEFIWIAEADDTCEPGMLAALAAAMQDERVAIAYCQSKRLDENGVVTAPDNLRHTNELDPDRWRHDYRELGLREVVDWLLYRNTIPNASACLLRKSAISGIEEELSRARFSGDRLLYAHMLRHGDVTYVAQPLNGFRRHRRTVTTSRARSPEFLAEAVEVRNHICACYPVHRSQLPGIVHFIDKDYRVEGVNKNSEHPAVMSVLETIEAQVRQNRRFAFITANKISFDGGSELWWRESAKRLRALGHDVVVLIKKWDPPPPFLDEFEKLGIKSYLKEEQGFERIIGFNPDLVMVSVPDQDYGIEYYGELRKRNIPYIIVNRLTKEPRFWPIKGDRNDEVRDGYLGARKVFFASVNNKRVMEEQRLGCKLPHWGIIYSPNHAGRNAVLQFPPVSQGVRLAVPANIRFVHKGQDLIVDVMKKDRWRKRDVTINLYGVGEDEDRLREMVRKAALEEKLIFHGKLVFVGREHEISRIWLHNHAILLPSRMEGFANTVIHAMMSGRVPIVTDIGGHGDVIEDGVTGFIASDPTPEALDDAMERAYQGRHEWEEIGRRARQAVLNYLPEDPVADAVDKILQVVGLEPVHAAVDAPGQE